MPVPSNAMRSKMTEETEETQEFIVKATRNGHGFVKVRARNKNLAKRAAQSMDKKRLLKFYKHELEFVKVGEATVAPKA